MPGSKRTRAADAITGTAAKGSENLLIASTVSITFVAFMTVALPLAVLPLHVQGTLGFSPAVAGFTLSLQYVATVLSRTQVGRLCDRDGPKPTVIKGLAACVLAGGLMVASALTHGTLAPLGLLLLSRLALGTGESLVSTGAIAWAIGRIGPARTSRIISWNGIATYGALAVGAPFGVLIDDLVGFVGLGCVTLLLGAAGLVLTLNRPTVPVISAKRLGMGRVLQLVLAPGLILALSTLGFGTVTTFLSLYFNRNGWPGAALALSGFGLAFIAARLLFSESIDRYGGVRVAQICLVTQTLGLLGVWVATSPALAIAAATLTGGGFALVFPALGVEAVARVSSQNRGAAIGLYSTFLDLALGVIGPVAGLLATHGNWRAPFLCGALATLLGLLLTTALARSRTGADESA
jgi:MFS family permease